MKVSTVTSARRKFTHGVTLGLVTLGLAGVAGLGAGALGCASPPPYYVVRGMPGERLPMVSGDPMRLQHPSQERYGQAKSGYHVVHSLDEWKRLFPSGEVAPAPTEVNFSKKMIILAVGDGRKTTDVKVTKVLDTASTLHIFVRESLEGEGCKNENEGNAYDAVITDRLDKNVLVHVEVERGSSCGAAPTAQITCRQGAGAWTNPIAAQPNGSPVECEAVPQVTGSFALVEQSWRFSQVPNGSASKMAFSKNNTHVAFPVDLFGTYVLSFDVVDEARRRGTAQATVEVLPPKDGDTYVQIAWTKFEANDDLTAFPRVNLRITEDGKPAPGVCAKDVVRKPDFCDVREQIPTVLFHLKGARDKFLLETLYTDERAKGGPYVCVRTFLNGAKAAEACDDVPRAAESVWTVGLLDARSGKLGPPPPPPPPPPAAPPVDPKKPVKPAKPPPKPPAKPPAKKK